MDADALVNPCRLVLAKALVEILGAYTKEVAVRPRGVSRDDVGLSVFEPAPTLDQGEGRAPSARLGQLGLGLVA
jgi:hypothetical protein